MKRIGIITFFNVNNYGAVLQAFALQKFLQKMGNIVEIIDFYNPEFNLFLKPIRFSRKWYKHIPADIINLKNRLLLQRKFKSFIKENITKSKQLLLGEAEDYVKQFDVLIAGGDQIWNPMLLNNKSACKFYFMDFYHPFKISFSSSVGSYSFNDLEILELQKIFSEYKAISLREIFPLKKIQELYSLNEVLDPTFLHDEVFYNSYIKKPKITSQFHLLYLNTSDKLLKSVIKKNYSKQKLNLICINQNLNALRFIGWLSKNIRNISSAGIEDFLGLIASSKFIITNTYHGVCFSLIFNKNFCYISNNPDCRIKTLLKKLNLINRIIANADELLDLPDIDYVNVNIKIDQFRKQSVEFLKMNIQ